MSDRRAFSAGNLAAASVAANEPWRVAVGGNRVQNMTVDQIAHAFAAGQLTVRTPLWPPGTSGWQALGNFEQFQQSGAFPATSAFHGGMPQQPAYAQLSQFEEADDDPTRMWTGSPDYSELHYSEQPGMEAMPMDPPPPVPSAPPPRESARTGPRQVSSRPAARSVPPVPPVARTASVAPIPNFRPNRGRGSGVWLAAGLVGLVGLGSAVLAVRGGWSSAAPVETAAVAAAMPKPEPAPTSDSQGSNSKGSDTQGSDSKGSDSKGSDSAAKADEPAQSASAKETATEPSSEPAAEDQPSKANQAQLAKYDDSQASAFVAEAQAPQKKRGGDRRATSRAAASRSARAEKSERNAKEREASKPSSTAKRATAAAAPAAKAAPATEIKEAKSEEKAEAGPVSSAVNEAAATALGNAAKLASSCRPQGGPSGPGKARVIYSNDGEVSSVEILTAKFRDTLTGSCVRMVFRRAKIEAFKGEPPTFIKSFTIPEQ